jgi:ABC-type phosphate transport system ATPase subunit
LEKAIIEHNMVAASKVYDNIHFSELGKLLEVDAGQAGI